MIRGLSPNDVLLLLRGLGFTALLTVIAFVGSAIAGLIFLAALVGRTKAPRILANGIILAIQGIPLLGILFLIFFGLALINFDISRWLAAMVALSIYGGAYLADIWRGAVESIPKGQWESAAALGLRRARTLRLVIYPQAFAVAIPPTVGFLVQLIKNTSLASVIGVVELTRMGAIVNGATFRPFIVYGAVCVLYFALCYPLTCLSRLLERRLARTR